MATITKYEGKKGITWQVKIRKRGKTESASFPTKALAQDWATQTENDIVQQKYFPQSQPSTNHTVNELLDIYEARVVSQRSEGTQGTYRKCLEYWRRVLGDTYVTNVTPATLEDCRHYLLNSKGHDAQTVNLYCNALSPAFSYAASPALNWITKNPFSQIKRLREKEGRAPQLTDQQIQNLLQWCDRSQSPHLSLFVRLVLCTGARKTEALTLKWGQINLRRKTVTFIKTKSRAQRTVPLPSFLVNVLQDEYDKRFGEDAGLMNDPTGAYLFPMAGNPRRPATNIHAAFNRARRRAGLPDFRIHDGRHHFASRMILDGGSDILAVSNLLGHANLQETKRYAHLTHSHVAAQVEKMARNLF